MYIPGAAGLCLPHDYSIESGRLTMFIIHYVSTSLPKVPILAHTIDSKLPQLFSHISRKSMLAGAYKSKIVRMHNVTKVSRGLVTVCEQIVYKLVSSPE